jgi:endonuclease YncB( thermonuclease family)
MGGIERASNGRIHPRVAAVLALLLAAVGIAVVAQPVQASTGIEADTVVSVYDGDTLTLSNGQRVWLLQIDTPELGSGECYSRAARTELLRLVPLGSRIVLEADPRLDRVDRYGRLLRNVIHNGQNVNIELVRRGAAAPYFYGGDRGRYANVLAQAATSAKRGKQGLWKACPATSLNPYRAIETGPSGPPSSRTPVQPETPSTPGCDPSYQGACLNPAASDYDCAGGSGNGPYYTGPVRMVGPDHFRLDADGDGYGCE